MSIAKSLKKLAVRLTNAEDLNAVSGQSICDVFNFMGANLATDSNGKLLVKEYKEPSKPSEDGNLLKAPPITITTVSHEYMQTIDTIGLEGGKTYTMRGIYGAEKTPFEAVGICNVEGSSKIWVPNETIAGMLMVGFMEMDGATQIMVGATDAQYNDQIGGIFSPLVIESFVAAERAESLAVWKQDPYVDSESFSVVLDAPLGNFATGDTVRIQYRSGSEDRTVEANVQGQDMGDGNMLYIAETYLDVTYDSDSMTCGMQLYMQLNWAESVEGFGINTNAQLNLSYQGTSTYQPSSIDYEIYSIEKV